MDIEKKAKIVAFAFPLLLVLLVAVPICFLIYESIDATCLERDVVTIVGGCDRNGRCGFVTKSNYSGSDFYPVVGKSVCVKH